MGREKTSVITLVVRTFKHANDWSFEHKPDAQESKVNHEDQIRSEVTQ